MSTHPTFREQQVETCSPDETYDWAKGLAASIRPGMVLALLGDLGAGKTCFVQGLTDGLEVEETVSSPTFTLVNEYSGRLPVYHMDVYRLADPVEALDLGLDEYLFGCGVTVIEWADRLSGMLPASTWTLHFSEGGASNERRIRMQEGPP